jgi:hypothetical protein
MNVKWMQNVCKMNVKWMKKMENENKIMNNQKLIKQ